MGFLVSTVKKNDQNEALKPKFFSKFCGFFEVKVMSMRSARNLRLAPRLQTIHNDAAKFFGLKNFIFDIFYQIFSWI